MINSMKSIAAIMLTVAMMFVAGCKPEDDPNNGGGNNGGNNGGGTFNGHACVDLGLPSGTLWATCNVGANAPEEYGDYFAWGETTPKNTYLWNTYKYCNGGDGRNTLTKYCHDSKYGYNGFTDNLTILQAGDDAAAVNWGSGWCTPTKEQWIELVQNTTHQWTTLNGVDGMLFTATNGITLFWPAAGYRGGAVLSQEGSCGWYWANSLNITPSFANMLYFKSLGCNVNSVNERFHGYPIRPVLNR